MEFGQPLLSDEMLVVKVKRLVKVDLLDDLCLLNVEVCEVVELVMQKLIRKEQGQYL